MVEGCNGKRDTYRLGDTLNVVTKDLAVTLSTTPRGRGASVVELDGDDAHTRNGDGVLMLNV